jgi:hypothetical protein
MKSFVLFLAVLPVQLAGAVIFPANNTVVSNACTLPLTLPAPANSQPASISFTISTTSGTVLLAGVPEANTFLVNGPFTVNAAPSSNNNVTIPVNASALSYGNNKAYVAFEGAASSSSVTYVTIEIDCFPPSTVTLNPTSATEQIAQGSSPTNFVLPSAVNGVNNTYSTKPIGLVITPDPVSPWLVSGTVPATSASPANTVQPSAPGNVKDLSFNINPAGLAVQAAPYTGFLHIRDAKTGYGAADLTVQLSVTPATTGNATLPHFAVNGVYVTDFYLVNTAAQSANYTISFLDDNGSPFSMLVQGLGLVNRISGTLPPSGSAYYEAGDATLSSVSGGSARIVADASVGVQGVFRLRQMDSTGTHYYEAAVPATAGSMEFAIPFDLTVFAPTGEQIFTGIAIANLDSANLSTVSCTARDSSGNVIPNAVTVPPIAPNGHWAGFSFSALTGKRGTLDCTGSTVIGAIALHAFAASGAISSLPVLLK